MDLLIGWENGLGDRLGNDGYGESSDFLYDEEEVFEKNRLSYELDIEGEEEGSCVDYGTDRFDPWTQEELDRLPHLHDNRVM